MSIFCSSKVLGFENDPVLGPTGSCGIPEFGTSFTRGMLMDTQPNAVRHPPAPVRFLSRH